MLTLPFEPLCFSSSILSPISRDTAPVSATVISAVICAAVGT